MIDIIALLDHPTTSTALIMARRWYKGRRVGPTDAFTHALNVVDQLHHHIHDVSPDVLAAALLHDSPELVAPPSVDLDATLTELSPEVARLVHALQHEHDRLGTYTIADPPVDDLPLMQLSAADKLASIHELLHRARISPDTAAYWIQRRGFVTALPYYHAFRRAAEQVLPPAMAADLGHLVGVAEQHATRHGRR